MPTHCRSLTLRDKQLNRRKQRKQRIRQSRLADDRGLTAFPSPSAFSVPSCSNRFCAFLRQFVACLGDLCPLASLRARSYAAHNLRQNGRPFCRARHENHSGKTAATSVADRQNETILSPRIDFSPHATICNRRPRDELRERVRKAPKQNARIPERQTLLPANGGWIDRQNEDR